MGLVSKLPQLLIERTIHRDIYDVFSAFSDYTMHNSRMPQYFPSIRVRSKRGDVSVVETHMNLGDQEITYTAKHVSNKPKSHDIFFIGGDCKGSHIRAEFVEMGQDTKVIVTFDLKLGILSRMTHIHIKYDILYGRIIDEMLRCC